MGALRVFRLKSMAFLLSIIGCASAFAGSLDGGFITEPSAYNSIAVGSGASVAAPGSIAIGTTGKGKSVPDTTIEMPAYNAVTVGYDTSIFGNSWNSLAFGTNARIQDAAGAISMGWGSTVNNGGSIALGDHAKSLAGNALSIGAAAQATAMDAIAVGNNALSTNEDALSLGNNAIASGKDSIALGSNSVASRDNSVSVGGGAAGYRQITNVAAGSDVNDAVNVQQLRDAQNDVATTFGGGAGYDDNGLFTRPVYAISGTDYDNVGDALNKLNAIDGQTTTLINNIQSGLANGTAGLVQQNQSTKDITVAASTGGKKIILSGAEGTRQLTGLSNGAVANDSTDAVNGSQLFSTNTLVEQNALQLGDALAEISKQNTSLDGIASAFGGGASVTADGQFNAPRYSVQNATYRNAGDALSALDNATTSNTQSITNLRNDFNTGTTGLVKQDLNTHDISIASDTAGQLVNFNGIEGARLLTGVKEGRIETNSTDAVNGHQLFETNKNVQRNKLVTYELSSILGGGASINGDGLMNRPTYTIQGKTADNVGEALNFLDQTATQTINNYNDIQQQLTAVAGNGLVKQNSVSQTITIGEGKNGKVIDFSGADGARSLKGVNKGEISATSTDAVNGAQLHATNQQVAHNTENIASLTNNVSGLINGTTGMVTQSPDKSTLQIGAGKEGHTLDVAGKDGNRVITGVESGVADNDAATVGQLRDMSKNVTDSLPLRINTLNNDKKVIATGEHAIAMGSSAESNGLKAVAIGGNARATGDETLAFGAHASAEGQASVAMGTESKATASKATALGYASSANAAGASVLGSEATANGYQSSAIGHKSQALAANSVALGSGSIADRTDTVSVGSRGNERQITNVAAGKENTDAANMGQLRGLQGATNDAFKKLSAQVEGVENKLSAGVASAMAMTALPQAFKPDSNLIGAAVSGYGNNSAIAVGISHISENGKWQTKLNTSANSQKDFGAAIGIGYQW